MLPVHIEELLQEQITADLRKKGSNRRDVEQRALTQWSARRGGLRPQVVKVDALLAEIEVRAEAISGAIRNVLQEVRLSPYPELIDDLVRLFDSRYEQMLDEIKPPITRYLGEISLKHEIEAEGRFGEQIEAWRAEHRMEVKRLGAAIMEPVHGSAVQQGKPQRILNCNVNSGWYRAHYLDASAAVKLVLKESEEAGSEIVQKYFADPENGGFEITSLCLAEALGVLKRKWQKDKIPRSRYFGCCYELLDLVGHRIALDEIDLANLDVFRTAMQFAKQYNLDLSDALQLVSVKHGKYSSHVQESQTMLITADEGLAQAARAERLLAWNCRTEPPPR